ncbi:RNA polymerase sigma-70 factor, ECF subfamily [Clostridium cavendishii DSM 21758]|uniref:RNA polymerase sigma-70 factor, ECF subfamily n=1 Tax=Clostridium cavendishii DSM 21758 TaxID=1121302 RepID=A0A1M6D949_9CLOT|nr:sigma-70 family RNA polymerase sigma factor [Clostridium cavendishii]SHI69681.1 RNA polymerase sigma-70 factor, ECF subfamily [Clostridium cavendishii DSM 21758]
MELNFINNGGYIVNLDVAKAINGDKEAFEELIRTNKDSMYRIAKTILSNEDDIIEAMQEATLKAYKGINKLRQKEFFKTWLFRILINECNEVYRKKNKEIIVDKEELCTISIVDKYENMDLKNAINTLNKDMQTIINLYYYEDLSVKDISSILNIPENTVKTNLSRARKRLYSVLKEGYIYE